MLSQNQMVALKKAIERTYDGTCTIIEQQKVQKENKSTGFEKVVVLANQPCRLSFSTSPSTKNGEAAATVTQSAKLFLSPEIRIQSGSKLCIVQNGRASEYKNSGEPMVYDFHQEIMLELFKGWA